MPHQIYRGDYPADWPEIARRVKDEAGWRCVRCDHPHDPESGHMLTLGARPILPIKLDMAYAAKGDEVRKSVRLPILLQSEVPKRNEMRDGQLFGEFVPMLPAMAATMPVAMTGTITLLSPVRAVVRGVTTLPMRTVLSRELAREPKQAARIATEASSGLTSRHAGLSTAALACVREAITGTCARAVAAIGGVRGCPLVFLAASLTCQGQSQRALPATLRTVHLLGDYRSLPTEFIAASRAPLCNRGVLARKGAIAASVRIARSCAKGLVTSLASQFDHAGIIPFRVEDGKHE